jgi:tetratricopeptide (TPR) repeat protein
MNRVRKHGILALALGLALTGALMAQKQPQPKSQKEVEALQAMFNAQDPDARIQAANAVITKFADTEFKPIALFFIAQSYEQKGDLEKAIAYAEQTLVADPKNYQAMLIIAGDTVKRTREFDLDKEEKLVTVEKYAKQALATIAAAEKPNPQITDDQWNGAKKDMTAMAHESLGLAAQLRKKYDVAITELKAAVDGAANPDAATMVRLAQTYNMAQQYDNAIPLVEKVMAMPDVHPQIKQVAQAERARAFQAKQKANPPAAAPPAANPPAPPAK